jgi:transcriptional regulator with XRE-family HTH domain
MEWLGENIKIAAKERRVSLAGLAEQIGVSRQTVNDWVKGQIPKGHHLLSLCRVLKQEPDYFFIDNAQNVIITPAHRKRRNAKLKPEMQDASFELSREYELLFRQAPKPELLLVTREQSRSDANAHSIARQMRGLAGIEAGRPIDYGCTFRLLERLGINVVFRDFPAAIKSYAFYTAIHGHRVVFVNHATNVIDLIFPLLHETIHAVRDEVVPPDNDYDQAEENFCDLVAGYIQFPAEYVSRVYNAVAGRQAGSQVDRLKLFGREFSHSLFGIVKQIQRDRPDFTLSIGGADTNLKKEFPTVGQILCEGDDARRYVETLALLSPNFTRLIAAQAAGLSDRKLCELLGLDGVLDRKTIREELEAVTASAG